MTLRLRFSLLSSALKTDASDAPPLAVASQILDLSAKLPKNVRDPKGKNFQYGLQDQLLLVRCGVARVLSFAPKNGKHRQNDGGPKASRQEATCQGPVETTENGRESDGNPTE